LYLNKSTCNSREIYSGKIQV